MPRLAADQYQTIVRKPGDIDQFWDDVLGETAGIPLEPEVVHDPLRSSEDIDVYEVFFTSLDQVRIAGWYAVPRGRDGRLPGDLAGSGVQHGTAGAEELGPQGLRRLQRRPKGASCGAIASSIRAIRGC